VLEVGGGRDLSGARSRHFTCDAAAV